MISRHSLRQFWQTSTFSLGPRLFWMMAGKPEQWSHFHDDWRLKEKRLWKFWSQQKASPLTCIAQLDLCCEWCSEKSSKRNSREPTATWTWSLRCAASREAESSCESVQTLFWLNFRTPRTVGWRSRKQLPWPNLQSISFLSWFGK